jgi:hypothetical protein
MGGMMAPVSTQRSHCHTGKQALVQGTACIVPMCFDRTDYKLMNDMFSNTDNEMIDAAENESERLPRLHIEHVRGVPYSVCYYGMKHRQSIVHATTARGNIVHFSPEAGDNELRRTI